MNLLKRLSLCFALGMLLVSCSGKETPATDAPATTEEAAATTTANPACSTAPEPGPCKAQIEKFYFDQATQKCVSFNYGGCQGTVPFETLDTCQAACEATSDAMPAEAMPAETAPADAAPADAAPADAAPEAQGS